MLRRKRTFHNFMSDRKFRDDEGEDTLGRFFEAWNRRNWGPKQQIRALAQDMMDKATPRISRAWARAMAYSIIGIDHLAKVQGASKSRRILVQLADVWLVYTREQDQTGMVRGCSHLRLKSRAC
jgi:hypothetical protein